MRVGVERDRERERERERKRKREERGGGTHSSIRKPIKINRQRDWGQSTGPDVCGGDASIFHPCFYCNIWPGTTDGNDPF